MAQLMPLPLTVSCFSKIQIGFTFLVLAYPGSHGQRAIKWVCVFNTVYATSYRWYYVSRVCRLSVVLGFGLNGLLVRIMVGVNSNNQEYCYQYYISTVFKGNEFSDYTWLAKKWHIFNTLY